ncbi:glycosyltransferase family 28 C-terminal domain protein [Mycobacterium xenopi 3993]|nr:glycosyltransferase family 28 C-terminal domain protein [Mycobacterium xenopi 3993]
MLSAVPDCGLRGAEVVGVPVRSAITGLDRAALRSAARPTSVSPKTPGCCWCSAGRKARRRSTGRLRGAADLAAAVWPCCTPTAQEHRRASHARAGDPPYVAVPYLDRMELAYAAADLAICRSGAMTVAEVSAVGLPAVYVPLPIGNGEQRLNALPVVNAGGGMLVADADLTPRFVADQVAGLLNDPARLAAMTAAARAGTAMRRIRWLGPPSMWREARAVA